VASAEYSVKIGAAGTGTINVRTNAAVSWVVAQVSIELPSAPSGATADIRKNDYLVTPMIPSGDVAAGDPRILLRQTDTLSINWAGCTPNTIGKALVLYEAQG
jgi:hypothetical protein